MSLVAWLVGSWDSGAWKTGAWEATAPATNQSGSGGGGGWRRIRGTRELNELLNRILGGESSPSLPAALQQLVPKVSEDAVRQVLAAIQAHEAAQTAFAQSLAKRLKEKLEELEEEAVVLLLLFD